MDSPCGTSRSPPVLAHCARESIQSPPWAELAVGPTRARQLNALSRHPVAGAAHRYGTYPSAWRRPPTPPRCFFVCTSTNTQPPTHPPPRSSLWARRNTQDTARVSTSPDPTCTCPYPKPIVLDRAACTGSVSGIVEARLLYLSSTLDLSFRELPSAPCRA